MEIIVGVDIGGTNTRVAFAYRGRPTETIIHHSFNTPSTKGPQYFLDALEDEITNCLERMGLQRSNISGIGCTLPGITDAKTGTAIFVSNLKGWDNFPLANGLQNRFGVPAVVDNDVNAAALGEYKYGAGLGCHSLVYYTISTGVAVGIILDGTLWRGYNHSAGELGFFVTEPGHLDKDWQPNGCLELSSAGVGLAKLWKEENPKNAHLISAIDVFDAANQGDQRAIHIVERAADYLSQSIIAICTLLDPERIVLSGSIAENQPVFIDRFRQVVEFVLHKAPEIVLSHLHGDAPLIGAFTLINDRLNSLNGRVYINSTDIK